ncbi:MAG TPA: hypothetical protein VGO91_08695, partial [Pyrinomonadaceae bacterium]|nr:hypothetical protein [Pyrinomonadaceae bacterium]
MKQCSTCQEEFADKFSFCPVDGTPLNAFVAKAVGPPAVAADPEETIPSSPAISENFASSDNSPASESVAENSALAAASGHEYHLTIIEDAGLTARLAKEVREAAHQSQLTWPEFKRDPVGFSKRSVST